MKKFLLTLCMIIGILQIAKAQTACADFVAGSYTITQENSFYGSIDVHHLNCIDDILLDPSCSIGAPRYRIRVAEFDLNTWKWTKDFCGRWELSTVPFTINVSDYFPPNEPTCGKIYAVQFVEGPTWNPADVLFFTIDCNNIELDETYACKENILYSDYTETIDKAYDQLLLDDGTRVITGTSYTSNHMRLFIEELDLSGNTIRKHAYPIQGDDVSNVQIIYDKQTDEYVLFFDTRIGNNRDVYFVRIDRATITTFIQYYGPLINDIPGGFSNEYAVKIEDDLKDKYMLVVNQQIPAERNSYVVMVDKNLGYAYCPSYININNSKEVVSHDIIETGGRINDLGCVDKTSYLLIGSVDNNAFIVGLDCNGVIQPNANIFDVDGNTATKDPAKRIQYYNGDFYIGGEVNSSFTISGTVVNSKIWLSSLTFNDAFHGNLSWLKIYDKNTGRKESLVDMDYADGKLYLTGQTEIEQGPVLFPTTVGPKAYFFSTDLSGNPIWSKEYFENPETESRLCDIELHCGAIYGIGGCNDQVLTSDPLNPIGEIEAQNIDIYRNKTNLLGELSGDSCYKEIFFEPIEVQPPVDLVATQPYGECIDRPPLDDYEEEELVCEVDCCINSGCQISSTLRVDTQENCPCCYILDLNNVSVSTQAAFILINITNPTGVFFDQSSITTSLNLANYSPFSLKIDNNAMLLPNGNTSSYVKFCFGNSGTLATNQTFTIKYFDINGNEIKDCEQEFMTDCELPPTDKGCVAVTEINVECDSLNYGQFKFTYQVTNLTGNHILDALHFTVVNPTTGIILPSTTNPIVAPIGPGQTSINQCIDIYDVPPGPYPKQVDIVFGANGYHQIDSTLFCCHDRLDTLSIILPDCTNCIDIVDHNVYCDDNGDYYLDFCVANNSTFIADELDIAKLSSTPPSIGLSQYLWNNATNSGSFPISGTFCETVQIIGVNPQAGDMIDLEFRFNNFALDSCCVEREILNIILPECCDSTEPVICEDFNDLTPTNTYNTNGVGNWNALNSEIGIYSGSLDNTPYLRAKDDSGGSWIYNNSSDYSGNWLDKGCELCFDYNFISQNDCAGLTRTTVVFIYQGTNPGSGATSRARFNLNNPISSGSGWHQICIPIESCSSGITLPSNSYGNWDLDIGTNCTDFTNLLTNVSGIAFAIDNGCSYQTETHCFDNLCFSNCCDMPCPPIIINNDVPILDGIYHAAQTVESAGTVPSTGNVDFKAGQNIRLNTGFSVATGATFSANIEPCCCSDDPLNDLIWLQPFIGDPDYSISRGTYQNQCVFIVTDFCVVSDGVTAYYDCQGNKICESYQIGTTCPANFSVQNITVLQGC